MAVKVTLKRRFWSGKYDIEVTSNNPCFTEEFMKNKDYVISVLQKRGARAYTDDSEDGGFYEFQCGPYFPNSKKDYNKRFS